MSAKNNLSIERTELNEIIENQQNATESAKIYEIWQLKFSSFCYDVLNCLYGYLRGTYRVLGELIAEY